MKTFYDIIQDVSNLRWSIVDPEPESFSEVQKAVKLAVPQANSYIWGLADFPFKSKKDAIKASAGAQAVLAPHGVIKTVRIEGVNKNLVPISAIDADAFSAQAGEPAYFWVEFSDFGAAINLYPVPNKDIVLIVRYETNLKAKDSAGNLKYNLEAMEDVLNLPEDKTVEDLYLHCLNTKSMVYLIADDTDENYKPYQQEFEEAYRNLLRLAGVKQDTRLVI